VRAAGDLSNKIANPPSFSKRGGLNDYNNYCKRRGEIFIFY